jgi:DNA-binding GntR family transcriptional regulator
VGEELFEIRAVLAGRAVRFAVPEFDEESLTALELASQTLDKARRDPKAWVQRHADFHDLIVRVSRRHHLRGLIRRIHSAVQPYLLMYISVYEDTEMVGFEHDNVISVIRTGNPAAAEAYMIDHVRSAGAGVINYLARREREGGRSAETATDVGSHR